MTPEPVPSAVEKKKLFFPRGEIILFMAPGGTTALWSQFFAALEQKKNPPGGKIF